MPKSLFLVLFTALSLVASACGDGNSDESAAEPQSTNEIPNDPAESDAIGANSGDADAGGDAAPNDTAGTEPGDEPEPEAGEPEAGEPEAGEPEAGEPEAGEPSADAGPGDSDTQDTAEPTAPPTWAQQAYLKASNNLADWDTLILEFGFAVTISADGNLLAVGARYEGGDSTGVGGDQGRGYDGIGSGAVYIFVRDEGNWTFQEYIKASNTGGNFGTAVSLSADGATLAVGAPMEESAASGIDGDQFDDSLNDAGAVYVFTREGDTWTQQAYVKASNPGKFDYFGQEVALSGDGDTLVVGAIRESSGAAGINAEQDDDSLSEAGAAYVYTRAEGVWTQQAYIKPSQPGFEDQFGNALSLSWDGDTLAVGVRYEDSGASGVNGELDKEEVLRSGAVYVFTRSAGSWSQQAYIKAEIIQHSACFGWSVSLSDDGNMLAVGAASENGAGTGVGADPNDNDDYTTGAVYLFVRDGDSWKQEEYIKASNTGTGDGFGGSVSLDGSGTSLLVGAAWEASSATGVDGDQLANTLESAGAAYLFAHDGVSWAQQAYIKASNTDPGDMFGASLALSDDGSTFVVGAMDEQSGAKGVNGDQSDNGSNRSGAAYVFGLE